MDVRREPTILPEEAASGASADSVLRSPTATSATTEYLLRYPNSFFALVPHDVTRYVITPMLTTAIPESGSTEPAFTPNSLLTFMARMNDTEKSKIRNHFGFDGPEKMLLQAIINNNSEVVKLILDRNPSLLLGQRKDDLIIQSPHTWQTFKIHPTENPLAVAAKLKQIEMIKLLLPYYDQLAQDNRLDEKSRQHAIEAREAGLKAWAVYEMKNNEIVIPGEYTSFINSLINACVIENLAPRQTDFTQLSDNAENAIRSLLNLLVPKTAVELDNHIDVELLLLAAYQLYSQRFDDFNSWEQRDAFCIRVIGLIQSALPPETAKKFCEGLFYVFRENRPVGARAAALFLFNGESFYRADRDCLSGLGGKYLCDDSGGLVYFSGLNSGRERPFRFLELMSNKNIKFTVLMQPCQPSQPLQCQQRDPEPSNGCVIC